MSKDLPYDPNEKQTILVDFDGTMYSYLSGWEGPDNLPDFPVVGTKRAIDKLRKTYKVVVCSARCTYPGGKKAIEKWLKKWDIEVDGVTHEKLPHVALIDDRAFRFKGSWLRALEWLEKEGTSPYYLTGTGKP